MNKDYKSRSVGAHLTAGAENIVYTCPNNYTAHVILMFISNLGSGNKTIIAKWHNTHNGQNIHIIGGHVLSAYNFLKMDGSYLTLNAGDYISITPEAGSTMDATLTVEEYFDPTSRQ